MTGRGTGRGLGIAVALAGLLAAGCSRRAEAPRELPPPDQTYSLQGVVVQLPRQGEEPQKLDIHHQAVPEFVSKAGEVVGMPAMSMEFEIADGVDLAGLQPSDPIEFTFEVRWGGEPITLVTELRELPPGTAIDYQRSGAEAAEPPAGGEGAADGEAGSGTEAEPPPAADEAI